MTHNKAAGIIFMAALVYQGFVAPILHGIFGGDFSSSLDLGSMALNAAGVIGVSALHTIEKIKNITK